MGLKGIGPTGDTVGEENRNLNRNNEFRSVKGEAHTKKKTFTYVNLIYSRSTEVNYTPPGDGTNESRGGEVPPSVCA